MPVMELMRVDGREPVGARSLGRARNLPDVGDVGRQLHQHGRARFLLHPAGDHLGVFGHLPHRAPHAALAHAMRASEIQLQAVGARVFGSLHDVVPGFARRLHHQRRDHRVLRIALLHFGDLAQIGFDGPVRDQLDIVQPHHALAVPIHRRIARRHVGDGLADGFPHRAAPTGVERAHDLFAAIRRRRRGQPERIGRSNARRTWWKDQACASPNDSAIATPARFPSATASTTSRPPLTQSPPA